MKGCAFVALTVAVLGSTSLPALAADPARARLAAPVSEAREVIVDGRLWKCSGQKCTSGSQGKNQPISRECARVVKVIGPVTEYIQGGQILNAKGLRQCNAAAVAGDEQAKVGVAIDAAQAR